MVGILDPDEGTVTYEDTNVHQCPEIKQKIVYVPDSTNILNGYTVKEIVKFTKRFIPHLMKHISMNC